MLRGPLYSKLLNLRFHGLFLIPVRITWYPASWYLVLCSQFAFFIINFRVVDSICPSVPIPDPSGLCYKLLCLRYYGFPNPAQMVRYPASGVFSPFEQFGPVALNFRVLDSDAWAARYPAHVFVITFCVSDGYQSCPDGPIPCFRLISPSPIWVLQTLDRCV